MPSPQQARRTPANTREREISVGKGDEAGGDFHRRGSKKNRKQKTFQNGKTKTREEKRRFLLLWFAVLSGSGEQGARRHGDTQT